MVSDLRQPRMDGLHILKRAKAVVSSSLNSFSTSCSDVTSAESMMMVKEHFIEEFGPAAVDPAARCSNI